MESDTISKNEVSQKVPKVKSRKKINLFILFVLMTSIVALTSCKKNEHEDYYSILVTVVEKGHPNNTISNAEIWTGSELEHTNAQGQCTITLEYDGYGQYFYNSDEFDFAINCYKSGYREERKVVKIKKTKANYTVTFNMEKK